MTYRTRGFTLAEVAVVIVVFSLVSTAILGCVNLAARYWSMSSERIMAEQNARIAMSTICNEFRQCIHRPSETSSIVVPDDVNETATELQFRAASPSFDLVAPGFDIEAPQNYQTVRYFVANGNALQRTVTRTTGATTSTLVQSINGSIGLTVMRPNASTTVSITITTREGRFQYAVSSQQVSALAQ